MNPYYQNPPAQRKLKQIPPRAHTQSQKKVSFPPEMRLCVFSLLNKKCLKANTPPHKYYFKHLKKPMSEAEIITYITLHAQLSEIRLILRLLSPKKNQSTHSR